METVSRVVYPLGRARVLMAFWLVCGASAQIRAEDDPVPAKPHEEKIEVLKVPNQRLRIPHVGVEDDEKTRQHGFQLLGDGHVWLARNQAARECSTRLVWAQWNQDVWHFDESAAHFDNCAWDEGTALIRIEVEQARSLLRKGPPDVPEALSHLGRALHAIQDFYAHSNFTEMSAEAGVKSPDEVALPHLWEESAPAALHALAEKGLRSGTFFDTPKHCPAGSLPHSKLAKDAPDPARVVAQWKISAFEAAFSLADRASTEFLRYAWSTLHELEDQCGPVMGYRIGVERRK